ncbi:hypothetical protein PR001_g22832 [Phytophthora rubi]|uniref:RxLR effector protein n=1 Tax=Phytophthora rubi TaxID=129364 RepID=A0A6A3IU16_9STRA|nr:hypothetical protein PR002_g23258 [Phytophthora rubi]KAE8985620.1 hypothetical protein PR001_g22832 [Phytophthora rubi]
MVIAASFLVASEAISTTTDSNQVEKLTPLDHQRLLRTHHYEAAEDEAETEERGPISKAQMKALFEEVGIDWKMVKANPNYLQIPTRVLILNMQHVETYRLEIARSGLLRLSE